MNYHICFAWNNILIPMTEPDTAQRQEGPIEWTDDVLHFCTLLCALDTDSKGLHQLAPGPFGFWLYEHKGEPCKRGKNEREKWKPGYLFPRSPLCVVCQTGASQHRAPFLPAHPLHVTLSPQSSFNISLPSLLQVLYQPCCCWLQ